MTTTASLERNLNTRTALVEFLATIVRPGGNIEDAGDSVNLFDPADLGTIDGILNMIDRAAS